MSNVKPLAARTDDEGELTVLITSDGDNIIIDFTKHIRWLAMPKKQAQEFALNILRKASDRYLRVDIPD